MSNDKLKPCSAEREVLGNLEGMDDKAEWEASEDCPRCKGSGEIPFREEMNDKEQGQGLELAESHICPQCGGGGGITDFLCPKCNGDGVWPKQVPPPSEEGKEPSPTASTDGTGTGEVVCVTVGGVEFVPPPKEPAQSETKEIGVANWGPVRGWPRTKPQPETKPDEWLSSDEWHSCQVGLGTRLELVNELLNKKHGTPSQFAERERADEREKCSMANKKAIDYWDDAISREQREHKATKKQLTALKASQREVLDGLRTKLKEIHRMVGDGVNTPVAIKYEISKLRAKIGGLV